MSTLDPIGFRKLGFVALVALSSFAGCSAASDAAIEDTAEAEEAIVDVPHTAVERQSIGNCWLYAHATWIESMRKSETNEDFDVSQSYWTYWHWFDQIIGRAGWLSGNEIGTGGTWQTANNIVKRYGIVAEKDFVPADLANEMSSRQSSALAAINTALKSGALRTSAARRNAKLVRDELDKAWGLTPEVVTYLDKAFGEGGEKTLAGTGRNNRASAAGTPILPAATFKVKYANGARITSGTVATAMSEWREVYYSRGSRAFHTSVQKALHARQPVIITWDVDFNAMDSRPQLNGEPNPLVGSFTRELVKELGPGRQGGHMTVLEDYEAKLGTGEVLKAGVTLDPSRTADAEKLASALKPDTKISFYRVKNSWGAARIDRGFVPGMPGYHDLHMSYLDGPIEQCSETEDAVPYAERGCRDGNTPLSNVVIPPGF